MHLPQHQLPFHFAFLDRMLILAGHFRHLLRHVPVGFVYCNDAVMVGVRAAAQPFDADPKDLYTTGLPMREVETIFNRLAPERVIFISDSCYSGATAGRTFATASRRAIVSESFLTRLSKGKGRIVLSASKASEVSEEREDLGHGVFTYYLLEGLRGRRAPSR